MDENKSDNLKREEPTRQREPAAVNGSDETSGKGEPPFIYYQYLAGLFIKGQISEDQLKELDQWYIEGLASCDELSLEVPDKVIGSEAAHKLKLRTGIAKRISGESDLEYKGLNIGNIFGRDRLVWWGVVVAALLLLMVSGYWFIQRHLTSPHPDQQVVVNKPQGVPGQRGAVLRLANGKTIILDSVKEGAVIEQAGVKLCKVNGSLKYMGKTNQTLYNEVITDKGRRWKMFLPDGTELWLNAGSVIRYPISFDGLKERIVTLKGEAYFKVVHNAAQPFKVLAGGQVIEDIGTAFNVHAYADEKEVRTTLVEGALKVNEVLLSPGWQARTQPDNKIGRSASRVRTYPVNTEEVTAWIRGQLSLNDVTIEEVMRQLSRWYNVEVLYEGEMSQDSIRLGGFLDKNAQLNDIVQSLQDFGFAVRRQNDTLVVGQ